MKMMNKQTKEQRFDIQGMIMILTEFFMTKADMTETAIMRMV